jgi:hypothetical protein
MRPSSPQIETLRREDSHCALKRLSGNEVFELWIEPMGSCYTKLRFNSGILTYKPRCKHVESALKVVCKPVTLTGIAVFDDVPDEMQG